MPNEEPEGPEIKPPKNIKALSLISISNPLKAKGIIALIIGVLVTLSYLIYFFYLESTGNKLNELYFIASGIGISVFTGLLFTFFSNTYVKTVLLFTSVFYCLLELIYIYNWVVMGKPYIVFKIALIIGLVAGIIYFVYDKLTNDPRTAN